METLYTYQGYDGPEFVIKRSQGRSYRCYHLADPDLYLSCRYVNQSRDELPFHTYTILATADHFTLNLVQDLLPEYFI